MRMFLKTNYFGQIAAVAALAYANSARDLVAYCIILTPVSLVCRNTVCQEFYTIQNAPMMQFFARKLGSISEAVAVDS